MTVSSRRRHKFFLAGLRWLVFFFWCALGLQVFFVARIAMMRYVDPGSTAFQRSELGRISHKYSSFRWSQKWVDRPKLPAHIQRAVIASEDDIFASHTGVQWEALERAWSKNARAEAKAQAKNQSPKVVGGSTITQQLAKNLFLSGERTFFRKAQELVLTLVLVFAGVATITELQEQVALFSQNYEALQLDELPLTLLVLSLGLWWFAWRRTQEAHAQLQERSRSELKVQELLQHKSDLLQRLYTAKEDERLALARELHDEMGQTSTAIRTEVAVLQRIGRLHPEADESVKRIAESAQHLSQMTRQMLHRLRPPALDSMGLEQALMTLCDNWQNSTQNLCEFKTSALPEGLNDYACVTVYRIVQEALTNVTRHAHAKHVRVQLTLDSQ